MAGFHGWCGKDQLGGWRRKPAGLFSSFGGNGSLASKEHVEPKGGIFGATLFSVISIIWRGFSISSFCRKGCFGGASGRRRGRLEALPSVESMRGAAYPEGQGCPCHFLPVRMAMRQRAPVSPNWEPRVLRSWNSESGGTQHQEPKLFSSFCRKPESRTGPPGGPLRETPCTGSQPDVLEGCHVR